MEQAEATIKIRKEEVLEMVGQMPDEIDIEELIYRLYLRQKIARGEANIAAGRTLSHEEAEAEIARWKR